MNCTNCPPNVLIVVSSRVEMSLYQIRRIKSITQVFNYLFRDILGFINDDLQKWVDLIPVPPFIDLAAILAYLTCPLTPLVMLTDPQVIPDTDPRLSTLEMLKQYREYLRQVRADYERSIDNLECRKIIRLVQAYLREIEQTVGDALQFPIDHAIALGYVTYIAAVCPELYNNPSYPFKAYAEEVTTINFNGLVPTSLDPLVAVVVDKVAQAQLKVLAWQQLACLVV
jgi:hypothetical protein